MGVYFEVFTCTCGTETANKVFLEKQQTSIVLSDLRTKVWIIITIVTIIAGEAYASQHTILYHRGKKAKICRIVRSEACAIDWFSYYPEYPLLCDDIK